MNVVVKTLLRFVVYMVSFLAVVLGMPHHIVLYFVGCFAVGYMCGDWIFKDLFRKMGVKP